MYKGSFTVEYEILPPFDLDERRQRIQQNLAEIDDRIAPLQARLVELNGEIDRLTNHADGVDYMASVASGILCGLIDSFVVGEFDFKEVKANSNRQVNDFAMKFAKRKGHSGDRLSGAISFLEDKYPVAQDSVWKGKKVSSASSHHLDDLAHHPTLLGFASAAFTVS